MKFKIKQWHSVIYLLVLALLCLVLWFTASPKSTASQTSKLPQLKLPAIAYTPRNYIPERIESYPSREEIEADLQLLRQTGFRSLVTYGSSGVLGLIPELARAADFDGTIIMGIWDPESSEEWNNALLQAPHVDGYCIGNEGLGIRYTPQDLAARLAELRKATGKPVTTSERIDHYLSGPYLDWLLTHSDWLFPTTHPIWSSLTEISSTTNWIFAHHDYLVALTVKPVILKEVGVPTAGVEGVDEEFQLDFFKAISMSNLSFFHFEAFDQTWKQDHHGSNKIEPNWGLFNADGTPKKIIMYLKSRFVQ